jgi:ankyrin repeat protein
MDEKEFERDEEDKPLVTMDDIEKMEQAKSDDPEAGHSNHTHTLFSPYSGMIEGRDDSAEDRLWDESHTEPPRFLLGGYLKEVLPTSIMDGGKKKIAVDLESDESIAKNALEMAMHPILMAARRGDIAEIVEQLDQDPDNLEMADFGGCTPMILACMLQQIPTAKFLINRGCNLNHRDIAGKKPYDYIKLDKDLKDLQRTHWLTTQDGRDTVARRAAEVKAVHDKLAAARITPMIKACFEGDLDYIRAEIERDSAMIFVQDHMGNTPLIAASATQQGAVIEILLEAGSWANVKEKTFVGYNYLTFARGPKKYEELRFLAEAATIEYKAHEHAKSLVVMAVDNAMLRSELEMNRAIKLRAEEKHRQYLEMRARVQKQISINEAENILISASETVFIEDMIKEEDRLNDLNLEIAARMKEEFIRVDNLRLTQIKEVFRVEKWANACAKKQAEEDRLAEMEDLSAARTLVNRIKSQKEKDYETAKVEATRRVQVAYEEWVEMAKERTMAKDRHMMPEKKRLVARMSKSAGASMH